MRWPRPDPVPATAVVDLFCACRLALGRRGHAAVIVDPPPGTPYLEFGHELVPAAARAGMGYLQHIIAVLAPIVGEALTAPAPDSQEYQVAAANGIHVKIHLDMLIFVVGGNPAGSAELTDSRSEPNGGSPGQVGAYPGVRHDSGRIVVRAADDRVGTSSWYRVPSGPSAVVRGTQVVETAGRDRCP
jgi:hypothetical protein